MPLNRDCKPRRCAFALVAANTLARKVILAVNMGTFRKRCCLFLLCASERSARKISKPQTVVLIGTTFRESFAVEETPELCYLDILAVLKNKIDHSR